MQKWIYSNPTFCILNNPPTMDRYTTDEVLQMEDEGIEELLSLLSNFAERKTEDLVSAAMQYAEANSRYFPEEQPAPAAIPLDDEEAIRRQNTQERTAHIRKWRHIFAYGIGANVIVIDVDADDDLVLSFV